MPRSWKGGGGVCPCGVSRRRAAGLAVRTRPCRSTTITPSAISSITSLLSCACCRASSMLPRALRSSRANLLASSLATTATANSPKPVKPACVSSVVISPGTFACRAATASRFNVATAAVASAMMRGIRMAAINTGNASKACELKALSERKCRPAKAARSTPIVARACRLLRLRWLPCRGWR